MGFVISTLLLTRFKVKHLITLNVSVELYFFSSDLIYTEKSEASFYIEKIGLKKNKT
jgi:hypothetical protein